MFSFSKSKKEEIALIFDIGSGSVGGAIVLVSKKEKPIILSSFRKSFNLAETFEDQSTLKEMLSSLDFVIKTLQKSNTLHVPENIYVFLSSPWAVSSFRNIKKQRGDNFIFTKKFVEDCVEDDILKFKNENDHYDKVIDKKIINILLNGYINKKPYGNKTKQSDIHLFLSLSSNTITGLIQDTIHKYYLRKIKFLSGNIADFLFVRDVFDDWNDFIILNIKEENTEISILKNDLLTGIGTISYGKNTIIRDISSFLNIEINQAKSLYTAYYKKHLNDEDSNNITQGIHFSQKKLKDLMVNLIRKMSLNIVLPHNVLIIVDDVFRDYFLSFLKKGDIFEFTTIENGFNVIIGDEKIWRDFCRLSVNVAKDSNLVLQSVFINNINFL